MADPHLHNPPCSLRCSPPVQKCIAMVITDNALSHLTFLAPYVVLVEVGRIVVIVEVTCAHHAITMGKLKNGVKSSQL